MPRRLTHVVYPYGAGPSARRLNRELTRLGYQGPYVNWGSADTNAEEPYERHWINRAASVALASNKRIALQELRLTGVPCPREASMRGPWPQVLRADRHHAGSAFWLANTEDEAQLALLRGATHAMEYIPNAREFRVHVAFGKSIKLTEKQHPLQGEMGEWDALVPVIRSHAHGWRHQLPRPDAHKVTLRRHAKDAVRALGLDFGAVDVLMRGSIDINAQNNAEFFVLEVNTAPGFAGEADTATRYARAFNQAALSQQAATGE